MIIKNWKLLESIENAIGEYNNELWRDEDEDKKLPYFEYTEEGESADVPEKTLSMLKNLRISLLARDMEPDELQDIANELSRMLDVMKLTLFSFAIRAKGMQTTQMDLSFLDHLNEDVQNISITGTDLSQENADSFERFKNLHYFNLQKCNISDPRIIGEINPKVFISLEGNKIAPEYYKEALRLVQNSNGRIKFSDSELTTIGQIHMTKEVKLTDYLRLMNTVDFDNIHGLTIDLDSEFDFENSDVKQIIDMLNQKSNITLKSVPSNLSRLDSDGYLSIPTRVIIRNASELEQEALSKFSCISSVQIIDEENSRGQQAEPYTREEYEKIRIEIDKILSEIDFPNQDDTNREKKIFAQIYRILGKRISYDQVAISEEEKNNDRLQTTCRNLLGGLLEGKCVCAGYADILRNVLACAGVYSEYVGATLDFENGVPLNLKDPCGHAWNLVLLDGKKYWTDLTWDANSIKTDRYPLHYCLKSTKEFNHSEFKKRLDDKIKDPCLESVSDEEQVMLFTGRELDESSKNKKQEKKNIGYLSSCVLSIASLGLTESSIRQANNEFNKYKSMNAIKEIETEVSDGRG